MAHGNLVIEATSILRQWFQDAKILPGTRLPSERSLAAQLGVKHYAFNRAMARLIAEGVVEREGYTLRYTPDARKPAPFTCELVVAQSSIHLASYKRVAKQLNIRLNIHTWQAVEETLAILHGLNSRETQCILFDPPYLFSTDTWRPIMEQLAKGAIPIVAVGQEVPGVTSVLADLNMSMGLAFAHLTGLGHQEIAHVATARAASIRQSGRLTWEAECRNFSCLSSSDRLLFFENFGILPEDIRLLAQKCATEWKEATALIIAAESVPFDALLEELARVKRRVPQDLSLVSTGEGRTLQNSSITHVTSDKSILHEAAFAMLQRALRKREDTGTLPSVGVLRLNPELEIRTSTREADTPQRPRIEPSSLASKGVAFETGWAEEPVRMRKELEVALKRQYPTALRAKEARFEQLDLSAFFNRPLNYRRGWLGGLPLNPLERGRHIIHGVPFYVAGGPARSDCGAVVFRSTVNSTGKGEDLPSTLEFSIGGKAETLYFLHGCGCAKQLHTFAHYRIFSGQEQVAEVPLVSLGQPDEDYNPEKPPEGAPLPNIQDWWPDFPHRDFPPHARMVPLLRDNEEHTLVRHDYLYTLEWINPRPDLPIDKLVVTADADQATTLGLLAVSILRFP